MDVSIVIVSYNAASYLKECIDSIFKFTEDVSFEIIVVDNSSTDNAVEVAKSFGKRITLIENKDNRGFGTGVNQGAKSAKGKYLLVLNPDIRFLENSLERLFLWMNAHGDVAVTTCQFLDSEQNLSPNGGFFPNLPRVASWAFFLDDLPFVSQSFFSYHPHASSFYNKEQNLDWVTGSFMFIRRDVWQQSGGFDEKIFMYGEEVELCLRLKKAGWKIAYTSLTKVIHHERGSQGGVPRGAILGEFKGLKYIYGKHYPEWAQVLLGSILDVAAFLRVVLWLVRLKPEMARIYGEALLL